MKKELLVWAVGLLTFGAVDAHPLCMDSSLSPSAHGNLVVQKDFRYELVWGDEFNVNSPVNPRYWSFEKGFVRNFEPQWHQEENAVCENGHLVITAKKERVRNPNYRKGDAFWSKNREYAEYTSSSLNTRNECDLLYGRMEIRAKIPVSSGAWPALWCKGYKTKNGAWPACGEVDILEFYSKEILTNVAWSNEKGGSIWNTLKIPFTHFLEKDSLWAEEYHVWRMDWDEKSIRLYLDDELLNTTPLSKTVQPVGDFCKVPNPFKTPMFLLLNLALRLSDGMDHSHFPLKYNIDYVRFYKFKDNPSSALRIHK